MDFPLKVRLFGAFELLIHDTPAARFRSRAGSWLLALLVLRRGRETERAWLAGTLWPESTEEQALYNLRRNLTDLRQVLGPEVSRLLTPTSHSLRFDAADISCDLIAYDDAIARRDEASLREAISLYGGEFLEGCEEDWVYPERAARHESYLSGLERLAAKSDPHEAVGFLRRVIAADPLRESAHSRLMEALAQCGDYPAVTQTFRDLRTLLYRELHAEPIPETVSLYKRLQSEGRSSIASSRPVKTEHPATPSPAPLTLPVYQTTLIGRENEREKIAASLKESRLVTLIGTGGVGKTRLAVSVGEGSAVNYRDGIVFVDLVPVSDPAQVAEAVAGALGLYDEPGRAGIDRLQRALKDRSTLLILDNCEHVVEACAGLVRRILTTCLQVRILATSRIPLHIEGEHVRRVPSLTLPPSPEMGTPVELMDYEAIRLFVSRATWCAPGFTLTDENVGAVTSICQRLDGIPLALELAAARMRGLSPQAFAERLDESLTLLASPGTEGSERQRTLRALLDWSHRLLSEEERILLRRFSVFSGGWRLEAAEEVCSGSPLEKSAILDLSFALLDHSLVTMEPKSGRYRLLETVRQYAGEHLRHSEEETDLRDRHLEGCVRFLDAADFQHGKEAFGDWIERLDEEHGNLRAALEWSLRDEAEGASEGARQRREAGMRLAIGMHRYWAARDLFTEGTTFLHALLQITEDIADSELRAQAWSALGQLAAVQGDYSEAAAALTESTHLFHTLGNTTEETIVHGLMGVIRCQQGDYTGSRPLLEAAHPICEELQRYEGVVILDALAYAVRQQGDYWTARQLLERAITLARKTGDVPGSANCRFNLGYVSFEESDYAEASMRFTDALELFRSIGSRSGEARCLCSLASVTHMRGSQEEAMEQVKQALRINQRIGHATGEAWNYQEMGEISVSMKNYADGQRYYEKALQIHRDYDCRNNEAMGLMGLAKVTLYLGQYAKSHRWHVEALRCAEALGMKLGTIHVLECLADLYRVAGQPESSVMIMNATARFREEMGAAMNEFVREGRELHFAELRGLIGDEAFEEAWKQGETLTLPDVLTIAYANPELSS